MALSCQEGLEEGTTWHLLRDCSCTAAMVGGSTRSGRICTLACWILRKEAKAWGVHWFFKCFFSNTYILKTEFYCLWVHRLVQWINHSTVTQNLNNPFHQNFLFQSATDLLGLWWTEEQTDWQWQHSWMFHNLSTTDLDFCLLKLLLA